MRRTCNMVVVGLVLSSSCGRSDFARLSDSSPPLDATDAPGLFDSAPRSCGAWRTPTPIAELNTSNDERGGVLTGDGLTLIWTSATGSFIAHRPNRSSPFTSPVPIPGIVEDIFEHVVSADGLEYFFTPKGNNDCPVRIVATTPFVFDGPRELMPSFCTLRFTGMTFASGGLAMYGNSPLVSNYGAVYRASRASRDSNFANPVLIDSLPNDLGFVAVTPDELELIAERKVGLQLQLFTTKRASTTAPWSALAPMTFASAFDDEDASITDDGTELVFDSNRPGGTGGYDLYRTTRTCP